jgi:hypothetical protein
MVVSSSLHVARLLIGYQLSTEARTTGRETKMKTRKTDYTIAEIAEECAAVALDNAGDPEMAGFHTPGAMWEGWHSKEGIDEPPIHPRFRDLYLDACRNIGGWDLVTEVLTGTVAPEREV